jgi:hypothetical protein
MSDCLLRLPFYNCLGRDQQDFVLESIFEFDRL